MWKAETGQMARLILDFARHFSHFVHKNQMLKLIDKKIFTFFTLSLVYLDLSTALKQAVNGVEV